MSCTAIGVLALAVVLSVVLVVVALVLLDLHRDRRRAQAAGRLVAAERQGGGHAVGRHDAPDDPAIPLPGEAVSVAELLERAGANGRGVRLNWGEADTDPYGLAAVPVDGDWPTEVMPRVEG